MTMTEPEPEPMPHDPDTQAIKTEQTPENSVENTVEDTGDHPQKAYDENGRRIRPNKTLLKKAAQDQQDALLALVLLSSGEREALALSTAAKQTLDRIAQMKASTARKREIRFAAKQFEEFDLDNLEALLTNSQLTQKQNIALEKTIEQWRDRLIQDSQALTALLNDYPQAHEHRQNLQQLLRQAAKEQQHNKPPAAARKLFKLLRDIMRS